LGKILEVEHMVSRKFPTDPEEILAIRSSEEEYMSARSEELKVSLKDL